MRVRAVLGTLCLTVAVGSAAAPPAGAAARSCGTVQAKGSLSGGLGWEATARDLSATGLSCRSARSVARRLAIARGGHGNRPAGWKLRRTGTGKGGFQRFTYARGTRRLTFTFGYAEG